MLGGEPRLFAQPGFFIGGPDQRTSKFVSESHPAMIVAGCPVLPLETGAGCLFRRLSPARVPLSFLQRGVLSLSSL